MCEVAGRCVLGTGRVLGGRREWECALIFPIEEGDSSIGLAWQRAHYRDKVALGLVRNCRLTINAHALFKCVLGGKERVSGAAPQMAPSTLSQERGLMSRSQTCAQLRLGAGLSGPHESTQPSASLHVKYHHVYLQDLHASIVTYERDKVTPEYVMLHTDDEVDL